MEFICVLSVGGSLVSYQVQKQSETKYSAILRTNNGKNDDIPAELLLEKRGTAWQAQPWHEEVVTSLTNAIEANTT